jgi:hypothetical protein
MVDNRQQVLVMKDGDGNWYTLTQDILDSARVPADRAQQLESALRSDVAGYTVTIEMTGFTLVAFTQNENISRLGIKPRVVNHEEQYRR